MALATRCPACNTIFRISTAQAAAKGGMVRCGQCANVFNSLDALVRVEDLDLVEEVVIEPEVEPAVLPPAPVETPRAIVHDDPPIALVFEPEASDRFEQHDTAALDALDQGTILDDARPRATFGAWWLPDPNAPPSTAGPIVAGSAAGTSTVGPMAPVAPVTLAPRDDAGQLLTGRRTDFAREPAIGIGGPSYLQPETPPSTRGRVTRWAFAVLSLVALLGLLAQGAYQWRDELAARLPVVRPWLVAACQPLRCTVGYPVHADSVTIESTAVQSAGPSSNLYTLTALLRNRDGMDVRYPHLNLVLTDLQDRPILRRALRPQDYLPASASNSGATSAFAADSELPIRVMFELNDLRFAGYRLEKFYP